MPKDRELLNLVKNNLSEIANTLKKESWLCACNAYDYVKHNNICSLKSFKKKWTALTSLEKEEVIELFYSFNHYEMLKEKINDNELVQLFDDFMINRYSKKLEKVK